VFPTQLRLQTSHSSPGAELFERTLGSSAVDSPFVLPLELQKQVRRAAQECALDSVSLTDGAQVTLWVFGPNSNEGSRLCEPLTARRCGQIGIATQSFALQPSVLQVERRDAAAESPGGSGAPLLYGESFRLRCRRSNTYLGHNSTEGALQWLTAKNGSEPPSGSRFASHGGELGTKVLLGRKILFARVSSPAPSPTWTDSEDEGSESEFSHSSQCDRQLKERSSAARKATKKATKIESNSPTSQPATKSMETGGEFLSSLADSRTFEAAFLPALSTSSHPLDSTATRFAPHVAHRWSLPKTPSQLFATANLSWGRGKGACIEGTERKQTKQMAIV